MDKVESDFQEAVDITLKNEGGLSENSNDPGSITKYGISLKFLKDNDIKTNGETAIDAKEVQSLTIDEAKFIYKEYFWAKFKIASIIYQPLADKVFDLSVNMGGTQAIKLLQEAINMSINPSPPLKEDGIIGPMTLSGIKLVGAPLVLGDLKLCAKLFYERLVKEHPGFNIFLDGWLKRAEQ